MATKDLILQCLQWHGKAIGAVSKTTGKPRPARYRELAEFLDLSVTQVAAYATGRTEITVDLVIRIKNRFDKPWNTIGNLLER